MRGIVGRMRVGVPKVGRPYVGHPSGGVAVGSADVAPDVPGVAPTMNFSLAANSQLLVILDDL